MVAVQAVAVEAVVVAQQAESVTILKHSPSWMNGWPALIRLRISDPATLCAMKSGAER